MDCDAVDSDAPDCVGARHADGAGDGDCVGRESGAGEDWSVVSDAYDGAWDLKPTLTRPQYEPSR